jgi:Skp family chaperone for outer membrane proteins
LATLGLATYIGGHVFAQQQDATQQVQQTGGSVTSPMPRTRIAIINLQEVIKNYEKWKGFQREFKTVYDGYSAQFEKMKGPATELKTKLQGMPAGDAGREAVEQQMRDMDRSIQDLNDKAKRELSRMQDGASVAIFGDVQTAVISYAKAHDIELVMHYCDAVTQADFYHPANIERKLKIGACMPLFAVDGMDITRDIIDMLNRKMQAQGTGAAAQPAPAVQQ